MKKQVVSMIAIATSIFCINPAIAGLKPIVSCHSTPTDKLSYVPERICVFDIDETLVFTEKDADGNKKTVPAAGANGAINKCINAKYGIAIATASYPSSKENLETFRLDLLRLFPQLNEYGDCRIQTSYAEVRDPVINPWFIVGTNGAYSPNPNAPPSGANKAQSLDRIMRTYFGIGVGNSFKNKKNAYLMLYKKMHDNKAPSDKGVSGCIVLFDDNKINIDAIKAYDDVYGVNFQTVQVQSYENPEKKESPVGVTEKDVDKAFELMDLSCKP